FFSSRRRHTRFSRDWSSDVCSSDLFRLSADLNLYAKTKTVVGVGLSAYPASPSIVLRCCASRTTTTCLSAIIGNRLHSSTRLSRSEERRVGKETGSAGGRAHGNSKL